MHWAAYMLYQPRWLMKILKSQIFTILYTFHMKIEVLHYYVAIIQSIPQEVPKFLYNLEPMYRLPLEYGCL